MMNAKISPDIILLTSAALMWLMAEWLPQCSMMLPYNTLLFWLILLTGLFISLAGMRTLLKHKTTVRPDKDSLSKSATLVTTGIYKYTRNPVYLGMAIMLFAWMIFLESWISVPGIIIFILFINKFQIVPEEKVLKTIFGDEYSQYKKRVRRWL